MQLIAGISANAFWGWVLVLGLGGVFIGYFVREAREKRKMSEESWRRTEAEWHLKWSRAGFSYEEELAWGPIFVEEAIELRKQGITPEQAVKDWVDKYEKSWTEPVWTYSGTYPAFTPEEARLWKDAGYRLETAHRLAAKGRKPKPQKQTR